MSETQENQLVARILREIAAVLAPLKGDASLDATQWELLLPWAADELRKRADALDASSQEQAQ